MSKAYTPGVKAALLNRISLVLGAIGLFIAGLLSLEKALNLTLPCGAGNDCAKVSDHASGYWLGIPVANFGAGGYLMLLLLALFRTTSSPKEFAQMARAGLAISAIGAALSIYLQYVALVQLQATCVYCLASAATMIALFVVHLLMVRAPMPAESAASEGNATEPEFLFGGRKDQMLGIAVSVMALVAIGVGLTTAKGQIMGTATIAADKAESLVLVPDRPNLYGDASAPVTIVEFADLSCPSCLQIAPRVKEFVDKHPGKVRLVYRHFPLDQIHPFASLQAAVSEYAAEQGRFWQFLDAMIQVSNGQAVQGADQVKAAATAAGLDTDAMIARLDNSSDPIYERIAADRAVVDALGIDSTPTFIVLAPDKQPKVAKVGAVFELLNSDEYKELIRPE